MAGRAGDAPVNGAPGVWRCRVVAAQQDWPLLHVLAVAHPLIHGHAQSRAAARRRTRQLLLQQAGAEIAGPWLAVESGVPGAGRASISHDDGFSLVAWCQRGCIGVDIVGPRGLAGASLEELQHVSGLYLDADPAQAVGPAAKAQATRQSFAMAWARHEAKLKSLGLSLDEDTAAHRNRLAACPSARVVLPPAITRGAAAPEAWIAWHDGATYPSQGDGPRHG